MFKRNIPQPRQDKPAKGKNSIEVQVENVVDEYEKQRARIIYAQARMRECEDQAMAYYNKFLQRKAEIEIEIDYEYSQGHRDHLGSSKSHVVDERVGKDAVAGSAAANNKWYISQATMYAEIVQAELAMMQRTLYTGNVSQGGKVEPTPTQGARRQGR